MKIIHSGNLNERDDFNDISDDVLLSARALGTGHRATRFPEFRSQLLNLSKRKIGTRKGTEFNSFEALEKCI